MKKKSIFLVVLLIGITLLISCKKTDSPQEESVLDQTEEDNPEEKLAAEQKELYTSYIKELDRMLLDNQKQGQEGELYREFVGTIYLFYPANYEGGLCAGYIDGKTTFFQLVTADKAREKERQRYECRILEDGSFWFTYQTESRSEKDLPDYIVNNDVLRFERIDDVYDDEWENPEEEKELRRQESERYMAEETEGEIQEFWVLKDRIYRIDRDGEIFIDVAQQKEVCIAEFLKGQLNRINCQLRVSEAVMEEVEKYKPEGYSLLWEKNAWSHIAVCDLNHDGRMDYVAALYPDDFEEERRYEGFSPYEFIPQYYAASFWLLLSAEDDGYEQISLSDSIEYWDTALSLVEVVFVDEGILQLEYFVGRAPYTNAVLQFYYDEEQKDFYVLRSYYRDSNNAILTGDVDNYGKTKMSWYFSPAYEAFESVWESVDDVSMQDGSMLGYYCYSDSFQYRCENLLKEHHINSLIWEKEYELFLNLKEYYPSMKLNFHMITSPTFYGSRLVSGQVEVWGHANDQYDVETYMPIMVDKQEGTYVTVTGLLEKEEFAQIFDEWAKDDNELTYNRLTEEEIEWFDETIEQCWEKADLTENYLGEKDKILFLQIVEDGILMRVWPESDTMGPEYHFLIDKEYFWGTEVWDYF